MEKVRAFLAFEVSDTEKNWIEKKKREIMEKSGGAIRWVKKDNVHVTLHFFGKISEKAIYTLNSPLNDLAERSRPFYLKLNGLGAFPNRSNPRVLWAGLEDAGEKGALKLFYRNLCDMLEKEGIPNVKRPYTPHITLGRVKKKKALRLPEKLFEDPRECIPFLVREVVFFRSDLTPEGPIYQTLNHFPLGGRNYE